MKLSLIIPNYNNESYLEDCLESVLSQTYRPDEVIVADDASTDRSAAIIRRYEQTYSFIKGIYHQQNQGVALNRHHAIMQARGDYITTLDSDDYYYNRRKLEEEVRLIQKYKERDDKNIVAYSNPVLVNAEKKVRRRLFTSSQPPTGNIVLKALTYENPNPCDLVIKKSLYMEAGGYDPRIPIYEDWDLNIRLAARSEFHYSGVDGTAYRQHGSGLSAANYRAHIRWILEVFNKNRHLINASEADDARQKLASHLLKLFLNFADMSSVDREAYIHILHGGGVIEIPDSKRKYIQEKLERIDSNRSVVIYGAGIHTEMLFSIFRLNHLRILFIADQNKQLQGRHLCGIPIRGPEEIQRHDPTCILISSCDYRHEIKDVLLHRWSYKGEIMTLYEDDEEEPFYR